MIKYTILYKNGKTWNGKCTMLRDIGTHKLEPRCGYDIPVWVSVDNKTLSDGDIVRFMLGAGDSGGNYTRHSTYRILGGGRFMMLIDVVYTSIRPTRTPNPASVTKKQKAFDKAYAKWLELQADLNQGRRGGADTSIKAYKKWLLLDEWGKPIKYSEPKKMPIKVTYTFWLGAFGEISDER